MVWKNAYASKHFSEEVVTCTQIEATSASYVLFCACVQGLYNSVRQVLPPRHPIVPKRIVDIRETRAIPPAIHAKIAVRSDFCISLRKQLVISILFTECDHECLVKMQVTF